MNTYITTAKYIYYDLVNENLVLVRRANGQRYVYYYTELYIKSMHPFDIPMLIYLCYKKRCFKSVEFDTQFKYIGAL